MSNETFKVGEIAIYARPGSPYFGVEVTIAGSLQHRIATDDHVTGERSVPYLGYAITVPGLPGLFGAKPEWLRKRRPPQDWVKLCNLADVPREVEHV